MRDLYKVLGILILYDSNPEITSGTFDGDEVIYIWIDPIKVGPQVRNLLELYGCFPIEPRTVFYYIINEKPVKQRSWEAAERATE